MNGRSAAHLDAIEFLAGDPPRKMGTPTAAGQHRCESGYRGESPTERRPVRRFQFPSPATETPKSRSAVPLQRIRSVARFAERWTRKGQSNIRFPHSGLLSNALEPSFRCLSTKCFEKKFE